MCWIKVSSAAGRSEAGFDVYHFEIRHRRKQSPRDLPVACAPLPVCTCTINKGRLCILTLFFMYTVICKYDFLFVCVSVGCCRT